MAYKWKPSASQRRAFAQRMRDPNEKASYEAAKQTKAEKRRSTSRFDYDKAGGYYTPTKQQHDDAFRYVSGKDLTTEQVNACEMVMSGYSLQEKVHHDYIHVVNELRRKEVCYA